MAVQLCQLSTNATVWYLVFNTEPVAVVKQACVVPDSEGPLISARGKDGAKQLPLHLFLQGTERQHGQAHAGPRKAELGRKAPLSLA